MAARAASEDTKEGWPHVNGWMGGLSGGHACNEMAARSCELRLGEVRPMKRQYGGCRGGYGCLHWEGERKCG